MTKSKIFFYFSLSFILGIFIGLTLVISNIIAFLSAAMGLIIMAVFSSSASAKKYIFIGFYLLFFSFGSYQAIQAENQAHNNDFVKHSLYGKEIDIIARVSNEADEREKISRILLDDLAVFSGGKEILISGKAIITTAIYPKWQYGDILKIKGKMEKPGEGIETGESFSNYYLKDGIYAQISFPKIEKQSPEDWSSSPRGTVFYKRAGYYAYSKILFFKNKIRNSIQDNFSPPYSSILEGMILGDNGALSSELKDKLNTTGLRHIISISGSHIVIISSLIMSSLIMAGFYRGQAFYLAVFLICLFIITAGLPASAVRAGIMGITNLLAQKIGRKNASSQSIVIAAAIMLFINPLLLVYDIGFQLSFLASLGIIYLTPILNGYLSRFIKNQEGIKEALSLTLAPQIFTLPLIIYSFGNVPLISPIANLLVAPAVSYIMIFGFLASFAGAVFSLLGWMLSIPCWIFLYYFNFIVEFFGNIGPLIYFKISFIWAAIIYLALFVFTNHIIKKRQLNFLN